MKEQHTITAVVFIGDREFEVPLKVTAEYVPGWPETRNAPEEPEHYEVHEYHLAKNDNTLAEAIADYLLDELNGEARARRRGAEVWDRLASAGLEFPSIYPAKIDGQPA